jgi:hypothetical protein
MTVLTRDLILNATELPQERVEVPQLGGEVIVWGLTAAERDRFEGAMTLVKGMPRTLKA